MKKRQNKRKSGKSLNEKSALYWQKKYLHLVADCKDMLSLVCNLMTGRCNGEEPFLVELDDEYGYISGALDVLRPLWDLQPQIIYALKAKDPNFVSMPFEEALEKIKAKKREEAERRRKTIESMREAERRNAETNREA